MARRPKEIELSVERPLGPDGGIARLSARFSVDGEPPSPSDLAKALDDLKADLDGLVGTPIAALPSQRPDRPLSELVGAYRPRQRELVDLLRDEGELSAGEHAVLVDYLASPSAALPPASVARPPAPSPEPFVDQSLAAMPIAAERSGSAPPPRPVPVLLREYQITSLKQAGAVRARRQISFAEYMALKRHFEQPEPAARSG
ncbi:MAG TPA: hypothetical protein VMG81_06955 [Thermoplasmata archaeon]|nr:hypothetical protein [Thermoplasmata archaeon]